MSTKILMSALKNLKVKGDVEYTNEPDDSSEPSSDAPMHSMLAFALSTIVFGISLMMYRWADTSSSWGAGIGYVLFVSVTQFIMVLLLCSLLGVEKAPKLPIIFGLIQSAIIILITTIALN